jgi:predicted CoA-binding protein
VFRPTSDTDAIIDQAIQRHADRGDVSCIWLQSGITSREGARKCAEAGITYIDDTCIYVVRQYLR